MEKEFKISGTERKQLKKKLSKKKRLLSTFWHYHQLDIDMCSIYGGSYPMSDDNAQKKYKHLKKEVEQLELILKQII